MEFVDNTGHIFSLPSYNEKPIGYEYEEYSYIFWIDSNNTSKLSVNNFYSRPIYALYELNKDFDISSLEDDYNSILDIEIYINNSNVFKLISSNDLQKQLSKKDVKLTDYIDLNIFENIINNNEIEYNEKFSFIKTKLTNKDLYCVKTEEVKYADEKDISGTTINYLMIPIYPIACAKEAGTWITNLMIHIHNNSTSQDEWCYISIGGEFVSEYEELIINGQNMGISLPKDILKSIYSESLYNKEYNEALFNEKLKEYLLNYMGIHGEIGNFDSAIKSLKWFGYGDKLTISKLLRTDNEFKQQFILDYFDISNDVLESFKTFRSNAFVSLMIHINKETDELYPYNFGGNDLEIRKLNTNYDKIFYGENKSKMLSLIDNYEKIKIGNHDMPIDEDNEKYWYWKPYFNFAFNELGIKLICLSYYYKKYFLPIHLNIHSTSLGYKVFANTIKFTNTIDIAKHEPSIILNNKNEVTFLGNGVHYFTKQIHYIDENFNEYYLGTTNIATDNREWYYLNDTCVNIPICFSGNSKYYNCVLLLQRSSNNETIYESHFSFCQNENMSYKNFIIYPKKLNIKINDNNVISNYFQYWVNNDFTIKLLVNNKWYEYNFKLKINNPIIDFGTLKYRYYFNDHNYLFNKITNNKDSYIHNILFCDSQDVEKIQNINYIEDINTDNLIKTIYNSISLINLPEGYTNIIINSQYKNTSFTINWENKTDEPCYVVHKFNIAEYDINFDINNAKKFDEQLVYLTIGNLNYSVENNIQEATLLIYPESWGQPMFIKNELKEINQFIYNIYDIENYSYVETFDLSDTEYIYQFFKQNYNILSPFKQIRGMDNDNKKILFNAYMHNQQLVNMNEINFDINLHKILKYHLEHNLMHIDGTLLDGEFYQYIIFTDVFGENHEVYIHKNLIGKPISFFTSFIKNDKILLCAYQGNTYMLQENYNESGDINYDLIDPYREIRNILFETEEGTVFANKMLNPNYNPDDPESEKYIIEYVKEGVQFLLYDQLDLNYNSLTNEYYIPNPDDPDDPSLAITTYQIYDKLYSNTDKINSKYTSLVNLPNNMKYKNSLHLFDIYTVETSYQNILIFHNNIDMYIDGLHFIHGTSNSLDNDEELKIYIEGETKSFIDSRYPDVYGLYWASSPDSLGNMPLLPEQISNILYKYGLYVKRNYTEYYSENSTKDTWELNNLFEYDTNEFTYYHDTKEICIGSLSYKTLDDFYNNNYYASNLFDEYKDVKIYIKETNNEHKYCFDDLHNKYIDDLRTAYVNNLSYELQFYNENNELIQVSLNDIDNYRYDRVEVSFFYNPTYIVRNRFYLVIDYINEISKSYNVTYNIVSNDDTYYLNIYINGTPYLIKLLNLNNKYIYKDNKFKNIISTQNPSMYWYNADDNGIQSLSSYLNEVERYLYNDNESEETIRHNLDKYVELYKRFNRYVDDKEYAKYDYKNYLTKQFVGLSGTYHTELITNINNVYNDAIRMYIEVIDNDGEVQLYNNGDILNLTGNEKRVTIYVQLNNINNIKFEYNEETPETNWYFIPKLIKTIDKEIKLKYNPNKSTSENGNILVKYLNQEFQFGDNNNEFIYDLYNDFFKLKFNIYDVIFNSKQIQPKLLNSIYDCSDELKLDTYLNYDFYLMHDYEYWYGLYISQETCDNIRNNNDLKLNDNDKKKILNNGSLYDKYILRHNKSSEEYLLNRLEFNTSEGFNQFNDDDIICCYVYNNDRLPFNASISSKWKIEPISLGMSLGTTFDSNGEMTILSLPKNNSKHEHGYYKVSVKYSLDRDIQHQFKHTSTIKIS